MCNRIWRLAVLLCGVFAVGMTLTPAQAEKIPDDRLEGFMAVMPAAPAGWTRGPQIGAYSSDSASTATATYRSGDGKEFSFVITFSARNIEQNRELLKDKDDRDRFGMNAEKIKGRDALVKKPDNGNKLMATFLIVLSDTRAVSLNDLNGNVDVAIMKAMLEAADLDAIAKR